MTLRRHAVLGLVLFAAVFAISALRGEAIALSTGDDDLCFAMGGPVRALPSDPADLADPGHACCDLGLCTTGHALPPPPVEPLRLPRIVVAPRPRPARTAPRLCSRRRAHTPRGPPRT